jgi:hypothetical protein
MHSSGSRGGHHEAVNVVPNFDNEDRDARKGCVGPERPGRDVDDLKQNLEITVSANIVQTYRAFAYNDAWASHR